jgi:arginine exporter protein ArgO
MKLSERGRDHYIARLGFWYSTLVLPVAALCILCGTTLFLAGITGNISWSARAPGGLGTDVTNAAPGVIFVIVGLLMICVTRFRQHHAKPPKRSRNRIGKCDKDASVSV